MTQMVDLDDLLPELLIHVPNLPEPLAFRFLRDAARKFCARTKCWRERDTIEVTDPEEELVCSIPDVSVVFIEQAKLDDYFLTPITVRRLDEKVPNWSFDTDLESQATYITQLVRNTFTIYPRQLGTLTLRYVLQPSRQAINIPEFLAEDYAEVIGMGAAAKALMMKSQEFFDPKLGVAMRAEFESELGKHMMSTSRGQQRARNNQKASFF